MGWTVVAAILTGTVLLGAFVKTVPVLWHALVGLSKVPDLMTRVVDAPEEIVALRVSMDNLNDSTQHLRESNHAIVGKLDVLVASNKLVTGRLDAHIADDVAFQRQVLGELAKARVVATEVKHDLAQFNEVDTLGAEGKIERRREDRTDLYERLDAIHDELRTLNTMTVGEIVEGQETRRIQDIPEADRTLAEQEHIEAVDDDDAPPPA